MVTLEPGEGYGFTKEGVVILSPAADGSNKIRTYGPIKGWILRSPGLSELEQDQFTSLSGVKRK